MFLKGNNIGEEGAKAISEVLRVNSALTSLDLYSSDEEIDGKINNGQ